MMTKTLRWLVLTSLLTLGTFVGCGDDSGGGGACAQFDACCKAAPAGSKGACGQVVAAGIEKSCQDALNSYKSTGICK